MAENFNRSIEEQSMEILMAVKEIDDKYKARLETLKDQITAIYKSYKAREKTISDNADQYQPEKVLELLYNLRKSVRQSLEELVKGRGFKAELDEAWEELKTDAPKNDIQQLIQVNREIELRKLMFAAGTDFEMQFAGRVMSGDPLTIEAITNSPIELPIDQGVLEDAKKRRMEILKPIAAKRYHALYEAQGALEALAAAVMPISAGDVDPLRDIQEGAPYGDNVIIG
jgi:hypothetical protein